MSIRTLPGFSVSATAETVNRTGVPPDGVAAVGSACGKSKRSAVTAGPGIPCRVKALLMSA
jgi:hypothetical protein